MTAGDYERFQQQIFDQMDELEQVDQRRVLLEFLTIAFRCGINVAREIKQGRPVDEVFERVMEERKKLKI